MLDNSAGANNGDQRLFLDEAIGHKEAQNIIEAYVPFKLPGHPKPSTVAPEVPFLEPYVNSANPGTDAEWNVFNKWILGSPLDEKDEGNPNLFTEYIRELAILCRHHNAALYSMRRMHYALNAPIGSSEMQMNPNGHADDKKAVPSSVTLAFKTAVKEAENRWEDATRKLRNFIRDGLSQEEENFNIIADMIEVNNYVVSMRVVARSPNSAQKSPNDMIRTREYTGISSSHVSLSSAFSSYSSMIN